MTYFLAALDNAYRQAVRAGGVWVDAILTSLSPLTYERGDYSDGTEKLDPDWEPSDYASKFCQHGCDCSDCYGAPADYICECEARKGLIDPSHTSPVCGEGPDGVVRHSPASTVGVPTLPMFKATDLQDIAIDYLANHFPWPDEGFIGCTCGKKDLTISEWCVHVSELQISELVFTLQGLVFDQSQQSQ